MPLLPGDAKGNHNETVTVKVMPNITYVNRKTGMDHQMILDLPYPVFLSYLVENHIQDLQQTEEGREYLNKIERLKVTEPDFSSVRKVSGFKQKAGE